MYGPELDVVAPSGDVNLWGDIWTLDRVGANGYNPSLITCSPQNVDYDCKFGGTSAACPEVSGIIALLLLRRPSLVGQTALIRAVIDSSSEDQVGEVGYDTPGWDQYYGYGRVNADRALMAVVRGDNDNSGGVDISDVVYLTEYIWDGGPAPQPHKGVADANCDGSVDISDCVYLIAYIFSGGLPPRICYRYAYN
jgi:subtilisin family serine protease